MPTPINHLFDHIHKVPQIPEVVRLIINQLNDPSVEMLNIAKNVEKEQVIALKILRLVNSAHFGLSRKVGSIEDATVMLGISQLKTLVIASGLVSAVPALDNFDLKQFWNNSFRIASYAKWFAEQGKLSADIAYTAGLIGNLGHILIHMGLPSEANEIEQHVQAGKTSRTEIEKNRLAFTSQTVCAELCRRWKFSDELIDTIEQSDEPLAKANAKPLAYAVFLARFVNDRQNWGQNEEEIANDLPVQALERINLTSTFMNDKLPELLALQSNLEGLAD